MNRKLVRFFGVAAIVGAACSARAADPLVNLSWAGTVLSGSPSGGAAVGYGTTINVATTVNGSTYTSFANAWVGLIDMNVNSATGWGSSPPTSPLWTYCVNANIDLAVSSQNYVVMTYADAMSSAFATNPGKWYDKPDALNLAGTIYDEALSHISAPTLAGGTPSLAERQWAAAGQFAAWEVMYDGPDVTGGGTPFDLTANNFKVTGTTLDSTVVADATTLYNNAYKAVFVDHTNPTRWIAIPYSGTTINPITHQTQYTFIADQALLIPSIFHTPPTPDGGLTLAMLGLSLGALRMFRRK